MKVDEEPAGGRVRMGPCSELSSREAMLIVLACHYPALTLGSLSPVEMLETD